MKVLSVSCNHCGAPLEVPHKTKFVTCKFCNSLLEIQRIDSTYFTNVIESVTEMKDDVETIKMQNKLERLDREWGMERERWMTTDKHGRAHVPSSISAIVVMVLACAGGIFVFSVAEADERQTGEPGDRDGLDRRGFGKPRGGVLGR